jgi:hypothetical protein
MTPSGLFATLLSTVVLAACSVQPAASPTPGELPSSGSPRDSGASPAGSAAPDESVQPSGSGGQPSSADEIVGAKFASVLVNGLAVRSEPGTTAPRVTCAPDTDVRLDAGDIVLVLADPPGIDEVSAWHRVVAPADDGLPQIGTPCDDVPFVVGWIATGLGDPWVSADVECPGLPTEIGDLAAADAEPLRLLACFGSQRIAVRGSLLPPPDGGIGFSCPGIEPQWLTCGIDAVTDGISSLAVRIPPGSSFPVDTEVQLVIELNHPAAQSCVSLAEDRYAPEAVVAFCRAQLVVVP